MEAREFASDICGHPGPALVLDAAIASIGFQLRQNFISINYRDQFYCFEFSEGYDEL